jgi:alpha-N-arabinofuranosidase
MEALTPFGTPLARPGVFQGISLHYYTTAGPWESKGSATVFDDDDYWRTMAAARRIEPILRAHASVMDSYDPDRLVGLVLDEWGTWWDVEPGTNPGFLYQQNTLRDALVASVHFDIFHAAAERLVMANIAQTVNVLQAMILTDPESGALVLTPTYHVFAMNAGHQDAARLDAHLVAPDLVRQVAAEEVPTLSLSASTKDGAALVSISNLDLAGSVELTLDLRGGRLTDPSALVLTADRVDTCNDVDHRESVAPQPLELVVDGDVVRVTIPAHSFVTVRGTVA